MNDIMLAFPEMVLAASGLLLLLFSAFRGDKAFAQVSVLAVCAMAVTAGLVAHEPATGTALSDMFAVGPFQRFVKVVLLCASGAALLLALPYWRKSEQARGEVPVLILLSTLGMMLMVSANNWLALYMGLELQNLPLYVLVAFRRDKPRSSEAALKYFTLSALSSALLLFGLSYVYGMTGTLSFGGVSAVLAQGAVMPVGLAVGIVFVMAGLAFKISAVPFHMWTPDVYEGAPTPVTAFLAAAPKVAALSLLVVVLSHPFVQASALWRPVLIVLAVASMGLGSIAGLLQTNIKRLMAYSAIANIATMLIGLVLIDGKVSAASIAGVQGVLIYLAVYAAGTLGVFGVLLLLRKQDKQVEEIADLAGLSRSHPLLALMLAASLFSLAGVPPLAGFFGKYAVLLAAVQGGYVWLAVLGVLASVVAAAYYLRIIKMMYFEEAKGLPVDPVSGRIPIMLAGLVAVSVVAFILYPAPLIEAAHRASESLLIP